jgi:hypothetical protein
MIRTNKYKAYNGEEISGIAANSADYSATPSSDSFVGYSGQFVVKANSATELFGVSQSRKAYASDNQTVANEKVNYLPSEMENIYEVTISGGSVAVTDENKFYKLLDDQTVDGTTGSTSEGQVRLVEFVSSVYGKFRIAGTSGK